MIDSGGQRCLDFGRGRSAVGDEFFGVGSFEIALVRTLRETRYQLSDPRGVMHHANVGRPSRSACSMKQHPGSRGMSRSAASRILTTAYVRGMTDDQLPIRWIHLTTPLSGLDEEFRRSRELYVLEVAEEALGMAGRMIAASKSSYRTRYPDRVPVFNGNVCIEPAQKIWFGDIDLTLDEPKLFALARALNTKVYVVLERDGRFQGRDERPLLDRAVYSVTPEGIANYVESLQRGDDGRLHPSARSA